MSANKNQAAWPDPATVAADIYKLLLDNDRVRVFDVRFKPGQKAAMHGHPDHVIYVLAGFKLSLELPGGVGQVVELVPGQALWMKAGLHAAQNTGGSEGRALVVELKEPL